MLGHECICMYCGNDLRSIIASEGFAVPGDGIRVKTGHFIVKNFNPFPLLVGVIRGD